MALETNDQYDFFRQIQIDDDGNLLVSIVNGGSGGTGVNYYTTAATLSGSVVTFDRTDQKNAYSVDLSTIAITGDYLPLAGGTLTGDLMVDADLSVHGNFNITGVTHQFVEGGAAATVFTSGFDGGAGNTIDFCINLNAGLVGGTTVPAEHNVYKVDLMPAGTAYTFSSDVNVLSIGTLTAPITVTLPSFANESFYVVKDKTGNALQYPITVDAGSNSINGDGAYIINIDTKPSVTFLWDGEDWITI